jgi:hypothetical protein
MTFLKAHAICPEAAAPVECLISDMSATGARLQPADGTIINALPERFDLFILKTGMRHCARIVWRVENELGVAFDLPADSLEELAAKARDSATRLPALRQTVRSAYPNRPNRRCNLRTAGPRGCGAAT